MERKARQIHIFCAGSRIKPTENKPKPLCMSGLDLRGAAGLEKFRQTLVLEASYHSLIVPCNVSGVNATLVTTMEVPPMRWKWLPCLLVIASDAQHFICKDRNSVIFSLEFIHQLRVTRCFNGASRYRSKRGSADWDS